MSISLLPEYGENEDNGREQDQAADYESPDIDNTVAGCEGVVVEKQAHSINFPFQVFGIDNGGIGGEYPAGY